MSDKADLLDVDNFETDSFGGDPLVAVTADYGTSIHHEYAWAAAKVAMLIDDHMPELNATKNMQDVRVEQVDGYLPVLTPENVRMLEDNGFGIRGARAVEHDGTMALHIKVKVL